MTNPFISRDIPRRVHIREKIAWMREQIEWQSKDAARVRPIAKDWAREASARIVVLERQLGIKVKGARG